MRQHLYAFILLSLCNAAGLVSPALGNGGVAVLTRREEGVDRTFDDLASGLDTGAISRGRAMKLAGAALVASALGLVGASEADAQAIEAEGIRRKRRRCNQRGGDFCQTRAGNRNCSVCCGRDRDGRRNRRKACCGSKGCNCCRRGRGCKANGQCR